MLGIEYRFIDLDFNLAPESNNLNVAMILRLFFTLIMATNFNHYFGDRFLLTVLATVFDHKILQ